MRKALNRKEQAIIETLQLTSEICTQRHFSGLFKKMREFMPQYFGFQGCGVLLYDKDTHWFFTEPLIIGEDDDHEVKSLHSSDEEDDKSADDNHEQFAR